MKRFGLILLVAAVAAGGIVYTVRHSQTTPHAAVTALLPKGTIAFAHVPDFLRTRDEWRDSDIYKLYQEPAVQEFLKPIASASRPTATSGELHEIEQLDPKDAFLAVTSIENNNPHFVGGFRFRGKQASVDAIISKWRSHLVHDSSGREMIEYQTHKIDIVGAAPNQVATVYDGNWFFASNDLAELKGVLDRADDRSKDRQSTLDADEAFRAALAHMPASYALLFYLQPKKLSAGISTPASADARAALEQLQSVCGAAKFEKGKIRDVLFVGAPKPSASQELSRNAIKLGTADTFLYFGALLNPDRMTGLSSSGAVLPLGSWLQKVFDVATRSGLTADDWKTAFDLEASALAEWPQTARLPSIVATLPVKDPTRAFKIADALTKAIDEDAPWTKSDRDGVRYYYMQSPVALVAITPTIAVSNRLTVVGLDSVSVEAAMTRSESNARSTSTLADSPTYKSATRTVATPTTGFAYIDTALLYSRLDSALRPILLMSAAFMPAISEYVDVAKLPPTEAVTKHLSPIISSTRYEADGYVTESVGPVTLDLGLALPVLGWLGVESRTRP